MLHDVLLEVLRFLDRDDLDACQLASKAIRNTIDGTPALPLRSIAHVNVECQRDCPRIRLSFCKDDVWTFFSGSLDHLRNAHLECLSLCAGAERISLLWGMAGALNYKVGRLDYSDNLQETETLDRSVDSIVRDLRVTDYKLSLSDYDGPDNERALLPTTLTHHSLRATAEFLYADVYTRSPTSVLFERLFDLLFDTPKLDALLRFSNGDIDGTQFADEFIRRFITADDVSCVAKSVSVTKCFKKDEPHRYLPQMCVAPRKQNVDAPKTRFFDAFPAARGDAGDYDLYTFKHGSSGSELQVFAMSERAAQEAHDDDSEDEDDFIITLITG